MNIGDYINYLFEAYGDARRRIMAMSIWLIIIISIAVLANYFYKPLNGVIGFFFVILLIWAMTAPQIIIGFFGIGATCNPTSPIKNGKLALKSSVEHFISFATWTSAVFMFAATLEFRQNIHAVMIVLPAMMLIALSEYGWNYKTHVGRPITFVYAVIVLVFCFGACVPKGIYYRTLGFNPYSSWTTSTEDKQKMERMEALEEKGNLTESEAAELKSLRQHFANKSFLGWTRKKASYWSSNLKGSNKSEKVKEAKIQVLQSGKVYTYRLAAGERSGMLQIPKSVCHYIRETADSKYERLYADGRVVDMNTNLPDNGHLFQFHAFKDSTITVYLS